VDQPNQKPHKSKLFVSEKSIKSFVLIHYELKHVCKIINEMFATVLCLLIFFNVVRMMLFFYVLSFVIVSMINDSPVRHKYKTFSSFIIWVFRLYYEVYVVARYCQDITNEVSSLNVFLAFFLGVST
jgi:7tm Chemosensory receptor.